MPKAPNESEIGKYHGTYTGYRTVLGSTMMQIPDQRTRMFD
jgi:hypothetical protein